MKLARIVPALLALSLLPNVAHAYGNANAKIVLHLAATTTVAPCTRAAAHPSCEQIDTSGGLYPNLYYAYVLITDGSAAEGVAGAEFGIDYNGDYGVGVEIYLWTLCATLELGGREPGWPNADSATLITWDASTRCQRNEPGGPGSGVVATAGYFYCAAYNADTLRIVPRRRLPSHTYARVRVANCASQEDIIDDRDAPASPSPLGSVAFSASGLEEGTNPCQKIVPVQGTTWSRLKSGGNTE
ncbi:MAG TPA: hypothetical protein VF720_02975 [Candidatus Eisenbacteria bacterium]